MIKRGRAAFKPLEVKWQGTARCSAGPGRQLAVDSADVAGDSFSGVPAPDGPCGTITMKK